MAAKNIMYKPDNKAWGVLHTPGLVEKDSKCLDRKHGHWPYYREHDDFISEQDDTLAAAVVIVECIFADLGGRKSWFDYLLLKESHYGSDPAMIIHDLIPNWKKFENPLRPLALALEKVARGEITSISVLAVAFEEALMPFMDALNKHPWPTLSMNPCKEVLAGCHFDFMSGSTYINS